MPNCVVNKCKNNTSKQKKDNGITYHILPCRRQFMKEKWIDIIRVNRNQPSWNPSPHTRVCSEHFLEEDFYITKKGLRRVKRYGYPKLFPATSSGKINADCIQPHTPQTTFPATCFGTIDADPVQLHTRQTLFPTTSIGTINAVPIQPLILQTETGRMPEIKYCIVCLTTNDRLLSLTKYSLGEIYSELTNILVPDLNKHVCTECATLIHKYNKFKLKCIRTDEILKTSVFTSGLTKNALETIQTTFNIGSNLAYSEMLLDEITDDVPKIDPGCSNIDEIKTENITDENITYYIDRNDDGLFVILKNESDNLAIDDSEENLSISPKSEDTSVEIYNHQLLDSKVILESIEDTTEKQKTSVTHEPNDTDDNADCNDSGDGNGELPPPTKPIHEKKKKSPTRPIQKKKKETQTKPIKKKKNKSPRKPIKRKKTETSGFFQSFKKYGTLQYWTQEQARDQVLLKAKSASYIKSPYKCDLCFRGYKWEVTLANHKMMKHNPQKGEYECDHCHFRYPKRILLYKHMRLSHTGKFTCKKCPFVCTCFRRAEQHVRIHEGKTYDCKYCDRKFNFPNTLAHHIVRHKDKGLNKFICEFCGSTYNNMEYLRRHKEREHLNVENDLSGPLCKQCGVHFASQQAWDQHLELSGNHGEHSAVPQRKTYRRPYTRRRVMPPTTCCGIEFVSKYFYTLHRHKYHSEPLPEHVPKRKEVKKKNIICEICGATFESVCYMKYHLEKHSGQRPYECQYCDKKYSCKEYLKIHENLHTRETIYKCDVCNMEFLLNSSFTRHMKVHKGFTPHECLECGQRFINKSTMNAHIIHKHQKIPYPKKNKNPERKRKHQAGYSLAKTEDEEK